MVKTSQRSLSMPNELLYLHTNRSSCVIGCFDWSAKMASRYTAADVLDLVDKFGVSDSESDEERDGRV